MPDQVETTHITSVTAAGLSRRLRDAGFGVSVMARHEGGGVVRGRAFVVHHGHDFAEIREWLTEHGLIVTDFGEASFDVSLPSGGDDHG